MTKFTSMSLEEFIKILSLVVESEEKFNTKTKIDMRYTLRVLLSLELPDENKRFFKYKDSTEILGTGFLRDIYNECKIRLGVNDSRSMTG
jgi:hypothetical protein